MKYDLELVCGDCRNKFIWTSGEQKFMDKLVEDGKLDTENPETGELVPGKVVPPKRCPNCRQKRKNNH